VCMLASSDHGLAVFLAAVSFPPGEYPRSGAPPTPRQRLTWPCPGDTLRMVNHRARCNACLCGWPSREESKCPTYWLC